MLRGNHHHALWGPARRGSAPWISGDRSGEWVWGEVAGEGAIEPRPPRLRVHVRKHSWDRIVTEREAGDSNGAEPRASV